MSDPSKTGKARGSSATVGIVGAGQLARMTIPAAMALGVELRILAERPDDSAAAVSRSIELGSPTNADDLGRFADGCDVLTFDHELVDADALDSLVASGRRIYPGPDVVRLVQDKLRQRSRLAELGCPIPAFCPVHAREDFRDFGTREGWPVVAKAVRGGYDGRGVWVLATPDDGDRLWEATRQAGTALLVESWVPIERELAALIARRPNGDIACYPIVETVQREGICRELIAPAPIPAGVADAATRTAVGIAESIDLVGVLAVELFQVGDSIVVNELAARVHNSGHFSIEGCATSQFEQHLRAVLDWPLGDTSLRAPIVATVNILGGADGSDPAGSVAKGLAVADCHVHLYGKAPRPGRKLGHVTALGSDRAETLDRARRAAVMLVGDGE